MPMSSMAACDLEGVVEDAIFRAPLFQGLPAAVLKNLKGNSEERRYEAGQTVFAEGQFDGSEFYVILSGILRLSIVHGNKGDVVIEDFAGGSIFGLEAVFSDCSDEICRSLAVTAHNDLCVLAVSADAFRKLAASRPSLMRKVAAYLAQETVTLRYRTAPAEIPPYQLVYAALLNFVEREPALGVFRIEKMLKHRELAELAGVDEADAAGAVAALIQDGVARRDYPGLIINDVSRLSDLSGHR